MQERVGGIERRPRLMLKALSFAVIFFVTFGVLAARISTPDLYDPPPGGDERDYEALAYNLWKGRGFGYFWSDAEWRAYGNDEHGTFNR